MVNLDPNDRQLAARLLTLWRSDVVAFCRDVLGFEPWDHPTLPSQAAVIRAAQTHSRITVRSGHKNGKSLAAAAIALSEYALWPGSRTILTAPTGRQVKQVLWREIRTLYRRARFPLGGTCAIDPGTGLMNPETDTQVLGFTTDDPDKFSGISGARVTYIVDEASGVTDDIFEAIEGNRAGGARLILLGNPTQPRGVFFDSHNRDRRLYKTFHISSADTANARDRGEIEDVPGLATKEWVDEFADRAGVESTEYQVRVEGNFPRVGSNSIFVAADVDAAIGRWTDEVPTEFAKAPLECGLDVARFGDDKSTLVMRRGKYVYEPIEWSGLDGPQLANRVAVGIARVLYPGEGEVAGSRKPIVRVDVAGVGASAYDSLVQIAPIVHIDVVPIDFAEKAFERGRYVNRRAELWFNAARAVKGMMIPRSGKIRDDLLAPGYKFSKDNRMQVEPKDAIKKRLGRSPDNGDAFALACDVHSTLPGSGEVQSTVSVKLRRAKER